MATPKIVPRAAGEGSLGDAAYGWGAAFVTNTTTSSASQGGRLVLAANDGAVMANDHRLGVIEFQGAQDSSGTLSSIGHNVYGFEDKYVEIPSDYMRNIKIVYTTSGLSFDDIKMAIKQLATTYYDNRAEYVKGVAINELPTNIKSILSKYVYYNEL